MENGKKKEKMQGVEGTSWHERLGFTSLRQEQET
jgi:hypothetical protein